MLSLLSEGGRQRLSAFATKERLKPAHRITALALVFLYNMTGFADILSTQIALASGNGIEANPVIRTAMESLTWSNGWIIFKLTLQLLVSAMVIWFPHRFVMALFAFVVVVTGAAAVQNLSIGGLL